MAKPLKTFIIYARQDEEFKNDLLLHLNGTLIEAGLIDVWQDGKILPGEDWEKEIEQNLEAADLFLILLSIHSLTSEFIRKKELAKALEKKSRIVPILVRDCMWETNPVFAGIQGLPKNMKPISAFTDQHAAWTEVMRALHEMVKVQGDDAKILELQKNLPDMVFVQGGIFKMGSPDNDAEAFDWEKPQHPVTIQDFYIGKYPVTQKFWFEVMGNSPSQFRGDELPVEQVSWDDCQEFLKKLNTQLPGQNFRLPTEAEWEYAARGGRKSKGYKYAGSNNINEVAWYDGNSGSNTHPVGQKKPNELGLYDMSGNVWEWVTDDWHDNDHDAPANGRAWLGTYIKGTYRVHRGGSWLHHSLSSRVTFRLRIKSDSKYPGIGFRIASSHYD